MTKDFLSEFIGNPQRARILRALIFNENEQFTASWAAKRSGLTPEIAVRELQSEVRSLCTSSPRGKEKKAHGHCRQIFRICAPCLRSCGKSPR
jgi:hypothetical protein